MKKILYAMIAVITMFTGLTGCSDNKDKDFFPGDTKRTLNFKIDEKKYFTEIGNHTTLKLDAGSTTIPIEVISNTRWIVKVTCEGGWCEVNTYRGSGDGTFEISVYDNMNTERSATIMIYQSDIEGNIELPDPNDPKKDVTSCSINIIQEASSIRISPSSVEPFAAANPRTQTFSIEANMSWALTVTYSEAIEFVTVVPEDESAMVKDPENSNRFTGTGNQNFRLVLQDNRTAADRKAFLTLRGENQSYSVEITQLESEYNFDVSPSQTQTVAPEGGEIKFTVLSLAESWTPETASNDWISFSSKQSEEGNKESIIATFLPNTTDTVARTAIIYFRPSNSNYKEVPVTVVQKPFKATFYAGIKDLFDVINVDGASINFTLDSRFDWTMTLPDWVSSNVTSGNRAEKAQTITLSVTRNNFNATRQGNVVITPQPTEFAEGVVLDPENLGVTPITLLLTQFGGREPAVSVPWLDDDYTQTAATVEFNFYSPFDAVVEAGLEWMKAENNTNWENANDTHKAIDNKNEGTVSFNLTGLDPATEYVARGYVIYGNNQKKYGATTIPFTTAGKRPGADDNPTPGM